MTDESSGYFDGNDLDEAVAHTIAGDSYVVGERLASSPEAHTELFYARRSGKLFILKSLRREFRQDPVSIAALRKEFDLGFRLDIPGIVKTYDILELPGAGLSVVLEHCPGSDLRQLMDSGLTIGGDALLSITRSLAEAVKRMHAAGVIHRDIKPSNIIYDPQSGYPRLIDFGCADSFDHALFKGEAGTRLYKSKEFKNTPGEDWYALSLTLAELAAHTSDRRAAKRILRYCADMKRGRKPAFDPGGSRTPRWLPVIAGILILLISGIVLYLADREKDGYASPGATAVSADSIAPDDTGMQGDGSAVTMKMNPPASGDASSGIDANENSANTAKQARGKEMEPADAGGVDNNGSTHDSQTAPRLQSRANESSGEVNFGLPYSSVKEDPLVTKIKDAAQKTYLAAERRKGGIYAKSRRLTQAQRDSIDRIVYDEKKICAAILAEVGPLPQGTDKDRVNSIIRQCYRRYFRAHTGGKE